MDANIHFLKTRASQVFSVHLLNWYNAYKRDLPWRQTKDPYQIWISEIILQQTRVDQGLPYYMAFLEKFPNVRALAEAEEKEVLKSWQGLGYYSRARNLHHTAKVIAGDGGKFPRTYREILKLKGVGSYTAAAISSICFNEAHAVVDGNVYRVLSRYYGRKDPIDTASGKKLFTALANEVMDKQNPGDYNQAIMEFGATHCKPSSPDCASCCLRSKCVARRAGEVNAYPVKTKRVLQRDRYFNYIMIKGSKGTFYQKRANKDIWQNMYEPFLIESKKHLGKLGILKSTDWLEIFGSESGVVLKQSESMEHKLSHQTIKARFWEAKIDSSSLLAESPLIEYEKSEIEKISRHLVSDPRCLPGIGRDCA